MHKYYRRVPRNTQPLYFSTRLHPPEPGCREVMERCSAVCSHSKLSGTVLQSPLSHHALVGSAPQANAASPAVNSEHLLEFKDAGQRGHFMSVR